MSETSLTTSENRGADWLPEIGQRFIEPEEFPSGTRLSWRVVKVLHLDPPIVFAHPGDFECSIEDAARITLAEMRSWRGTWEP